MKQCRECGKHNQNEASYCRHCGQPLCIELQSTLKNNVDSNIEDESTLPLQVEAADEVSPSELPDSHPSDFEAADAATEGAVSLSDGKPTEPMNEEATDVELADQSSGPENGTGLAISRESDPPVAVVKLDTGVVRDEQISEQDTESVGFDHPDSEKALPEMDSDTEWSLLPGNIVGERYRIVSVVSQDRNGTLYEAEDLALCWSCNHVQSNVEDVFCENCGASMEQKPVIRLREKTYQETEVRDQQSDQRFIEAGFLYLIEGDDLEKVEDLEPSYQMLVGFQSDSGEVRDVDEDSLLVLILNALSEMPGMPSAGFFAVADGIGGHQAGEIASGTVVRSLAANVLSQIFPPLIDSNSVSMEDLENRVKDLVLIANQDLLELRQARDVDMGCTLTGMLIINNHAVVANVGDSRTYLMRKGTLSKITEDHSVVARLLAENQIQPEEVFAHDQKNIIYRSMGADPELELDDSIYTFSLEPGDRLVLCCDGLWEMVPDSFIEDVLLEYFDPQSACDRLVEMANQAGGTDNISLIVVNFQALRRFR
jgi:serine/threonine protein phosphatase PrpC